jgi:hypothetical protein
MEIEIQLFKLYIRPDGGWRISVIDVQNFNTGHSWSLLSLDVTQQKIKLAFYE